MSIAKSLSVMDRYLISELIVPFLFGMGLFASLGLAIGVLFDLVRKVTESGLPLEIAIKVLIFRLPEFMVLAFPMSVLLATLMAYGRLSSDSELVAMRGSGIGVYRLIVPGMIFSLFVTGLTFSGHNFLASSGNYRASIELDRALKSVRDEPHRNVIYPEYQRIEQSNGKKERVLTRLFYADEFDGERMKNLTVLDRSRKAITQIIVSKSAIWNLDKKAWNFINGTIYLVAPDGSYRDIVRFDERMLPLSRAPLDLATIGSDYDNMNIFQAREYLQILRLSGDTKRIQQLKVYIQEKIAFPFVCLVFGLVGAAIAIQPRDTGKATSLGICVGLIFLYYSLSFLTNSLGVWGVLSPFLAAWLPNIIGMGAGGYLLSRANKSF